MKILLMDIETSPSLAYIWSLWDKHVPIQRLKENGNILCWAAKWMDEPHVYFSGVNKHSHEEMMLRLHALFSEADAVVHYNGRKFDIPTCNREWLALGMSPPAPHKDIDLIDTVKRRFRFTSNKLDFVAQYLGLGAKHGHEGFEMWVKCMQKDPEAWRMMKTYNIQDVRLLEKLYKKLLPWLDKHPSRAAQLNELCCPKCGGTEYRRQGFAYTQSHKYQQYQCKGCGGWFRGHRTLHAPVKERALNVAA